MRAAVSIMAAPRVRRRRRRRGESQHLPLGPMPSPARLRAAPGRSPVDDAVLGRLAALRDAGLARSSTSGHDHRPRTSPSSARRRARGGAGRRAGRRHMRPALPVSRSDLGDRACRAGAGVSLRPVVDAAGRPDAAVLALREADRTVSIPAGCRTSRSAPHPRRADEVDALATLVRPGRSGASPSCAAGPDAVTVDHRCAWSAAARLGRTLRVAAPSTPPPGRDDGHDQRRPSHVVMLERITVVG